MRKSRIKYIDKKVFARTAKNTKAINLNPVIYRGGYRL